MEKNTKNHIEKKKNNEIKELMALIEKNIK